MTKYNTINRYLFVFMAIMLLAASMLFGANANLKLHAEEEITDLTDTTWQFKDTCTYSGDGSSKVQFNVNYLDQYNHEFVVVSAPYGLGGYVVYTVMFGLPINSEFLWFYVTEDDQVYSADSYDGEGWYLGENREHSISLSKQSTPPTITITGGDDATNESANFAALLTWLQANATPVPAQEPSTGVVENVSYGLIAILMLAATIAVIKFENNKIKSLNK